MVCACNPAQPKLFWSRSQRPRVRIEQSMRTASRYSSRGWREMNAAIPGTVNATRPCSGA